MTGHRGVTFPAWRGDAFIALIEILLTLGPVALGRRWTVRGAEFAPGWRGSAELTRLASSDEMVSTLQLVDLVSDGVQVIDGPVMGEDLERTRSDVLIRSVRNDEWDVIADDESALSAIRQRFAGVMDLPSE